MAHNIAVQIFPHNTNLPSLHDAVNTHLRSYKIGGQPVSISRALDYVRTNVRDCHLPDSALVTIVADYAILHGLNIHFDGAYKEKY